MANPDRIDRIFVPRFIDAANTNAQNLNAKAMLSRFSNPSAHWQTIFYDPADPALASSTQVSSSKLFRRHGWMPHLVALYQQPATGIFYPGVTAFDLLGMRLRALTGRRVPIISTIEGLAIPASSSQLEDAAGHKVFLQPLPEKASRRVDALLRVADHVIAISPFLQKMGRAFYGDKFSCLPLGIDASLFHAHDRNPPPRPRVVSTGHVAPHKRPEMFLQAAAQNPSADFVWFGDGPQLAPLHQQACERHLTNLTFAGRKLPHELADELRRSSIFALCSLSEGAPKSLQEAAACGLPLVAFKFFEPPSIIHNHNGLLASNDDEFFTHIKTLVNDPTLSARMGARGADMAKDWDWNVLAPQWEQSILTKMHELSPRS